MSILGYVLFFVFLKNNLTLRHIYPSTRSGCCLSFLLTPFHQRFLTFLWLLQIHSPCYLDCQYIYWSFEKNIPKRQNLTQQTQLSLGKSPSTPWTEKISCKCRPVYSMHATPVPLYLHLCPTLKALFLSVDRERRIWVCLYVGRQSGRQTHPACFTVSVVPSVPVILPVQLVLSPDLWPLFSLSRKRKWERPRGERVREGKKHLHKWICECWELKVLIYAK